MGTTATAILTKGSITNNGTHPPEILLRDIPSDGRPDPHGIRYSGFIAKTVSNESLASSDLIVVLCLRAFNLCVKQVTVCFASTPLEVLL